jgi:hypothetical protein
VREARSLWIRGRPEPGELHRALSAAAAQLTAWERLRTDGGTPRVPDGLAEAVNLYRECSSQLNELRALVPLPDDAGPVLAELAAGQDTPWRLPRLYELSARFERAGLGPLLAWLAAQDTAGELTTGGPAGELAVEAARVEQAYREAVAAAEPAPGPDGPAGDHQGAPEPGAASPDGPAPDSPALDSPALDSPVPGRPVASRRPVPGSLSPDGPVPGSLVPGSLVPGSLVPGSLVPGSLVPGSLVPDGPAGDGPGGSGPGQAIAVREPASPQRRPPPG